jgi:hypothetical protein
MKKDDPHVTIKGKDGKSFPVFFSEQFSPGSESAAMQAIEGGILAKGPMIIAKAMMEADVVRIDPDDPNDDGEVIGKVGQFSEVQIRAMLAGLTEEWIKVGDTLVVPANPDGRKFMDNADADLLTAQLRAEMVNLAGNMTDGLPPEESRPLWDWIHDKRIENFREWLMESKGWAKLTQSRPAITSELERCFQGVPADIIHSVDWSRVKDGGELDEWPVAQLIVKLAGEKNAPVEGHIRSECESLEYFDALQACMESRHWRILIKTADTDDQGEGVFDRFAWLRLMARPYVEEQAALIHDRQTTSLSILIRPKATTDDGDDFTAFPRVLSLASLMGGQFSIQANGENYFEEPSLAAKAASEVNRAIKQRCVEIVPKQWTGNAHEQISLALNLDVAGSYLRDPFGGPLELMTRTAMMARMPNIALKMFPVLFAVVPLSGRWVEGKRRDWIPLMFPDYATGEGNQILPWGHRRQKKRDLEMLTAGFVCGTKGLQLKTEKPNGSTLLSDIWLTEYDPAPELDAINRFAPAPWLAERWRGGTAGGFFLLNMTRWTTLGLSNPRLFPLALRLNAIFDQHRVGGLYDPSRVKPIRWDELARQCNMLPLAAEGRSDETIKARTRQARAMIEGDLKALIDVGLLGAESLKTKKKVYGEGFEFLPIAPEDYAGACERANKAVRMNQERKAKKKGRQG